MENKDNAKTENGASGGKKMAEPPDAVIINLDADPQNADWLHRPHRKQKKDARKKKTPEKDT